jgi:NAD-dependent dihydropyrimidine dehydrogenase PreA subunit
LLTVDGKTCNRDGICAAVCPVGIIDFKKGELPQPAADAADLCIACGHCAAVCPTACISHAEMTAQACPPVRKDFQLSARQCEQFIRSRRSIRTNKDKSVPRKDIARLIPAGPGISGQPR